MTCTNSEYHRLYALSGITEDKEDFTVDHLTATGDIYASWARKRIPRTRTLDILSACADSSQGGLPSWVPDLRRPWRSDRALFCSTHNLQIARQNPQFLANSHFRSISPTQTGLSEPALAFVTDDALLVTTGRKLSTIAVIGIAGDITTGLTDPTKISERVLQIVSAWERMCSEWGFYKVEPKGIQSDPEVANPETEGPFSRFNPSEMEFADVLLRGYVKWSDEVHLAPLVERYHLWRWKLPVPWNYAYATKGFALERSTFLEGFERILFAMIHGCQMFVTEEGDIGMVGTDCHAQVGDDILYIQGSATPCILRKGSNKDTYRLMGPCYVSDIGRNEEYSKIWEWNKVFIE